MSVFPPPSVDDAPSTLQRESEPVDRYAGARLLVLLFLAALLGFTYPWILLAIVMLAVMIFLHELGHYMAAKRSGMKVTEFFLFFGPKVWSIRRGETEYGIKSIPLGAYVKVIGMNNLDPGVDPAEEHRTYRQASYPRRLLMASAGSLMHFLIALVLGVWLLAGYGEYRETSWSLASIEAGSPADVAGLRAGDRIVSIDGQPVSKYQPFRELIRTSPGKPIILGINRDGAVQDLSVTPLKDCGGTVGRIGVANRFDPVNRNLAQAVVGSASTLGRGVGRSVIGLGKLFSPSGFSSYVDNLSNKPSTNVASAFCANAGPEQRPSSIIGITKGVANQAKYGMADFLGIFIGINIGIGVFNLFPMLPFDGGHVVIATYERLRERKGRRYHADVSKLLPVVYAVLILMLFLFVTASYMDIRA